MLKVERFIMEYAAYVRRHLGGMRPEFREEIEKKIEAAIAARRRGFITAPEAVRLITAAYYH